MQKLVKAKQSLSEKKHENELVKLELDILTDEDTVYKLVGPILAKQDPVEAKANVEKRLEYLTKEIYRVEGLMEDFGKKMEEKRQEFINMQKRYQQQMAAAQQKKA
jgi:prefoldin beta subunit